MQFCLTQVIFIFHQSFQSPSKTKKQTFHGAIFFPISEGPESLYLCQMVTVCGCYLSSVFAHVPIYTYLILYFQKEERLDSTDTYTAHYSKIK